MNYTVKPPALLFDLDGTLIDSIDLILSSMRHAFSDFDGTPPTDEEWRAGIGRPLITMLRRFTLDDAEAIRLQGRYREYQVANHERLVHAYDGIVAAIQAFAAAGHPMALVTSKADWLATHALVQVGLDALIPVVVGCDSCERHKPHPEPVERALALLAARADNAIFVGDSSHDVESGRTAGVYTIGVTWGAFTREELLASGADAVIDEVADLQRLVAGFRAQSD